jgi:hypothetical protein
MWTGTAVNVNKILRFSNVCETQGTVGFACGSAWFLHPDPDLDRQYKGNSDPDPYPNEHQNFADPLHCYKVPSVWYINLQKSVR